MKQGWAWLTFVATPTASGTGTLYIRGRLNSTPGPYAGDPAQGFYYWHSQIEQGAFASSVIQTLDAPVTRAADVAVIDGAAFTSLHNPSEGTLLVEARRLARGSDGSAVRIDDGTNDNRIQVGTGASGAVWNPFAIAAGASQGGMNLSSALSPTAMGRVAMSYGGGKTYAACAAGGPIVSSSGAAVPAGLTTLRIGSGLGGERLNGHIRSLLYFPRRLDNATLARLTEAPA